MRGGRPGASGRVAQREAAELKVWREGRPNPLKQGFKQLDRYLDRFDLATGTLIVFDQRPDAPAITERTAITTATSPFSGRVITVMNC
ncbi:MULTISPECIES: hypothetical protein [unclassified Pseudofrankia]|uniref:hypothetical protein n=1 Tax=unclassified Pseudofrankia TaxID=2994372 RepID=UPI0008D9BCCC|nr:MULTISPECIES: hypothetical protein [unclassified Pseudofrankia]MDT3444761.1 hypothetical protein [Pseudofrankia sp. BMG5.37]OHV50438.1 hypothetical protein BCD48_10525 [Pseudofrankia sp. BMG5.36]